MDTIEETKVEETNEVKHFETTHDHADGDGEFTGASSAFSDWLENNGEEVGAGVLAPAKYDEVHQHDPDTCTECQMEAAQDADMQLAMTGFVIFGLLMGAAYYMFRSCKNQKGDSPDPSNPNSRGQYRPAALSPYGDSGNGSRDDEEAP